jgi:hypothetical protein
MSATCKHSPYTKADAEQLSDIHAEHIGRALLADDQARHEVVGTLISALANAIAFFSGPGGCRSASAKAIAGDLPAIVERCHAEITSIRGTPQ